MKRLLAAALLCMALLAPLAVSAADADGDGVPDPAPPPAAPAEPGTAPTESGGDPAGTSYGARGTYALDANGNKVSGDALSKLPPEARWAMETKGLSPILGNAGEVLGYDGGNMSYLPDSIGKDYAAAAEKAKLGPGVQGPCAPNFPNCHSQEPAQPPPPTETAGDVANMIPAKPGANHCDQPGPPPPCKPKEETAEEKAQREKQEADKNVAAATEKGDVNALADAIDQRNKAQADASKTAANSYDPDSALGSPGTRDADNGSGSTPIAMSGGRDQGLGPSGRVGGDTGGSKGGGLAGREVTPDSRALAQNLIDMNRGIANGPMDGPSDPNVASIAQVSNRGLGGRAMDAARSLFSALTENLGVAADAPDADLSDQLATNPIDGAAVNRAPIKIVECKNDTLGGTAGGRTSRRVGGC